MEDGGWKVAEEIIGECFGHLGFANACRADEEQRGDGALGAVHRSLDGGEEVGHAINGFELPDDARAEMAAGSGEIKRCGIVEEEEREAGLAGEGGGYVGGGNGE